MNLCKVPSNEKLTQLRETELKSIEKEYLEAVKDSENVIKENKTKGIIDQEFQNRFNDLKQNYEAAEYMMKQQPDFCDQWIKELKDDIDYFIKNVLHKKKIPA